MFGRKILQANHISAFENEPPGARCLLEDVHATGESVPLRDKSRGPQARALAVSRRTVEAITHGIIPRIGIRTGDSRTATHLGLVPINRSVKNGKI